jgi:LacI family transcriptional regulator, gluconate utilization system Gnt-I transcriptional repressor
MPNIKKNPGDASPAAPSRQRRGHGRATMQDVAAQAGVTAITVSRFLRAPEIVAPETAARIAAALHTTGYVPNKQAGQLASGRSRMVAAIIPSIANSIFAETVQGLSDGLQAAGYELLLTSTGYSRAREQEQIRAVLGWFPSALVVTGRHHSAAALKLLRAAQAANTPVVEIWDQRRAGSGFAQVGFNHAEVGRAMASHLIAQGHRRLAYVDSGVAEDFRAHERGQGFAAAAEAAGVEARLITAAPVDAFDAGRLALAGLLAEKRSRSTAIAFANDNLAGGALLEAQRRGVNVPGRLAIMGFGDFAIGRQLQPALTTVRPPRYEIGRRTAALLLATLRDGAPLVSQALAWELLPRGST